MSKHLPSARKVAEQSVFEEYERRYGHDSKKLKYKINEIFYSIQGEGRNAGRASVFIRFSACNLACSWCDTEYDSGVMLSVESIVQLVSTVVEGVSPEGGSPLIVCTGGEPSLQVDRTFCDAFKGYELSMETNGINWTEALTRFERVTISPKTLEGWWREPEKLRLIYAPDVKVIYDDSTPEALRLTFEILNATKDLPFDNRYIQPLENQEDKTTNVEVVKLFVMHMTRWKLSLQTHKLLGVR
jgi:organic radical activating enzyme